MTDFLDKAIEELEAIRVERLREKLSYVKCPDCAADLHIETLNDGSFNITHIKHN